MARVLNGETKRSNCVIRAVAVLAAKRSSKLTGSHVISIGTDNRSHIDCQKRGAQKLSIHQVRHRPNVRSEIVNSSHSARPCAPPPRGDMLAA